MRPELQLYRAHEKRAAQNYPGHTTRDHLAYYEKLFDEAPYMRRAAVDDYMVTAELVGMLA